LGPPGGYYIASDGSTQKKAPYGLGSAGRFLRDARRLHPDAELEVNGSLSVPAYPAVAQPKTARRGGRVPPPVIGSGARR